MDNIYIDNIKEIINKPKIKDAINSNDFETVYEFFNSIRYKTGTRIISYLTKIFYDVGIDPLLYMEKVPDFFLLDQKGIFQINIPKNIKTIGKSSFFNTDITELVIPEGVEFIEQYAFENCKLLKNIKLPSTLKFNVNKISMYDAFHNCPNLKNIRYAGTKEEFKRLFFFNLKNINYRVLITCQDGKMKYNKNKEEWAYID